jgi:uncharacterized membrane protein
VSFEELAEHLAKVLEIAGVLVIVAGIVWSGIRYMLHVRGKATTPSAYTHFRRSIGRSILLGLELLVAADIIHTVAATPTFESLGVLGLLIVIRTFLSIEIEMEIDGHWPWQRTKLGEGGPASGESS